MFVCVLCATNGISPYRHCVCVCVVPYRHVCAHVHVQWHETVCPLMASFCTNHVEWTRGLHAFFLALGS